MNYEEVMSDYNKLEMGYGQVRDFSGRFEGDGNIVDNLLGNQTKTNAKRLMIEIIREGFNNECWETDEKNFPIHDDQFLLDVYEKYIKN